MNNQIIKIQNLYKSFPMGTDNLEVLKGIDLEIAESEILTIIGESGSGKSTLLNCLGGLDSITSGKIYVNDKDISSMHEDELAIFRNKQIGFIFQFHHLLPDFTALENVSIPYLSHTFNKKEAYEKAKKLLGEVGLSERYNHKPSQLSGGEQQRVAVARSLINDPKILLADEPTGNLDERNSQNVKDILGRLREKYQLTIILVTHNTEIAKVGDRVIRLKYGVITKKEDDY